MQNELKLHGIYSLNIEVNKCFIILKELQDSRCLTYVLDCKKEISNQEIQERLVNDISNHFILFSEFYTLRKAFILDCSNGYVGQCEKEIIDKLVKDFTTEKERKS